LVFHTPDMAWTQIKINAQRATKMSTEGTNPSNVPSPEAKALGSIADTQCPTFS